MALLAILQRLPIQSFRNCLRPDMMGMDNDDIRDLLRQLEHRNDSDAELLLWQKEGHSTGYPCVGLFRIDGTKIAIVIAVPLCDAILADDAWIVPGTKALAFAKALCGEVVFKKDAGSAWKFWVSLPKGVEATHELQERIRLAFCLPECSTLFHSKA